MTHRVQRWSTPLENESVTEQENSVFSDLCGLFFATIPSASWGLLFYMGVVQQAPDEVSYRETPMIAHGWNILGFVLASVAILGVLGFFVRRGINAYRMRVLVRRAQVSLDLVDLGPVEPEFVFRPRHRVCGQIFRVGKFANGNTRQYCALCEGVEEKPFDEELTHWRVVHLASRNGRLVRAPDTPTSPTVA